MPGPVLHTGATVTCPHGAPLTVVTASPRVTVSGAPAAVLTDQGLVAGCPFTVPPVKPQPCVSTKWLAGAARVTSSGQPLLVNPVGALCLSADQIPAGPPIVCATQTRVVAT
ncbi:hypothetical protein [Streptomyces sp. CB03911]|uniref:hypothetical protein n=1 Tax=Streptomycetaceae TaxID=2062 RepID=UPI00093B91E3|nr:hypothetical protein [Streptomyces sp. CB03911]OKI13305.1 hypothetical protein A6A07_15485 [Streptomyces sp. CB03911]